MSSCTLFCVYSSSFCWLRPPTCGSGSVSRACLGGHELSLLQTRRRRNNHTMSNSVFLLSIPVRSSVREFSPASCFHLFWLFLWNILFSHPCPIHNSRILSPLSQSMDSSKNSPAAPNASQQNEVELTDEEKALKITIRQKEKMERDHDMIKEYYKVRVPLWLFC